MQLDVRIALAVFAVVALASSKATHNDNDDQDQKLTNDYASSSSSSNAFIRQKRSPVPPPKLKKPFKVGALLGLLGNKGDMVEPPPLLETILGGDGEETSKPLLDKLDKFGEGDGPLSTVKMFIPPIGQESRSAPSTHHFDPNFG